MIKVGITGGIGSGKSTVCRLFAACGAPVYDSDTQAKRLMEEDGPLRRRLAARFGEEIYAGGRLNRKLLAGRVFSDPAELSALNALVHPAVMEDFERWCGRQSGADYVVLESAILSRPDWRGMWTVRSRSRLLSTCVLHAPACVTGLRPRRYDAVSRSSSTKRSCAGGPTIPLSI